MLFVQVAARNGQLEIVFRDTGVGLSPEQAEKIFEPFQSDFEGGTGLGLAIVYQIVQAHKGSIRAESLGPGLQFRIEFPLSVPVSGKGVPTLTWHG